MIRLEFTAAVETGVFGNIISKVETEFLRHAVEQRLGNVLDELGELTVTVVVRAV